MSTFKTIDEAREFFTGDKFAMSNGMRIDELWEDGCLCSMDIRDDHRNAVGGVMGGVIFTLGDFAFAVASNNVHMTTVGQHVSISYLSGSRGKRLYAPRRLLYFHHLSWLYPAPHRLFQKGRFQRSK